jgi:predicted negative regulator of RcsB-dependent stress response
MSTKPTTAPAAVVPAVEEAKPTQLELFLDKHFVKIVYVCVAAIIVSAVVGLLKHRSYLASVEAATAATAAKTVDDCDVVIQKYKGSVAAGNAVLTKSKLLWEQNKKDPAVAALRDFISSYPEHPFYVQGLLSLASRLETMGGKDTAEAKSLFEKIVKEHKDSEVAGLAQLRIADMLWSEGKEAEAKKIYEEMPRQFIGQFAERVTERTEWIGAALPTKETDAPKIPDALKAPTAPAPGAAPAINLTPGKDGSPIGKSIPFEVKPQPAGGAPQQIKLGGAMPVPTLNAKPTVPVPTAATSAPVAVPPLPTPAAPAGAKPAPSATSPAAPPATSPAPAPAKPTEPEKK